MDFGSMSSSSISSSSGGSGADADEPMTSASPRISSAAADGQARRENIHRHVQLNHIHMLQRLMTHAHNVTATPQILDSERLRLRPGLSSPASSSLRSHAASMGSNAISLGSRRARPSPRPFSASRLDGPRADDDSLDPASSNTFPLDPVPTFDPSLDPARPHAQATARARGRVSRHSARPPRNPSSDRPDIPVDPIAAPLAFEDTPPHRRSRAANNGATTQSHSVGNVRRYQRYVLPTENDSIGQFAVSTASEILLRNTLVYLSYLRHSQSRAESIAFAKEAGFSYKDFTTCHFVSNINQIAPPALSSLLSPGSTFHGHQVASKLPNPPISNRSGGGPHQNPVPPGHVHPSNSNQAAFQPSSAGHNNPSNVNRNPSQQPVSSGHTQAQDRFHITPSADAAQSPSPPPDSWPVTVTIYDIDYETLTMSASMVAYDVPSSLQGASQQSPTSPQRTSNLHPKAVTTYLEGEIIDFRRNTLMTENFRSDVMRDLVYWRRLPPFKKIGAYELPHRLLNRDFLSELNRNYVLMRWKERCFVDNGSSSSSPNLSNGQMFTGGNSSGRLVEDTLVSTDGCGLTISGFYYVSMAREDGSIEGFYSDTKNGPYQCLSLRRSKQCAYPAWEFR
jgi:hypothetical protein